MIDSILLPPNHEERNRHHTDYNRLIPGDDFSRGPGDVDSVGYAHEQPLSDRLILVDTSEEWPPINLELSIEESRI